MRSWIRIFGGLLIVMGRAAHARSEALFYYFRLAANRQDRS
jgi:hypothetical protein